jgi:hypothetical protein
MAINLNRRLSKDFALWEFVVSPAADRSGISNTPNAAEIANLRSLCTMILQPARDALGPLKISSGFRSARLNKLVGGAPNSDHRHGYAADVAPVRKGTREFAEWVVDNCPEFDQVILEFGTAAKPNWIHVSVAPKLRRQVLRATRENGGTVYRPTTI